MVLQKKTWPCKKGVCMLTISPIYVKEFIHSVQIPRPFQAYGLNWKHWGLSLFIFAFYLHFKNFFFFLYFFKLRSLHKIISICLGRYTDLEGHLHRGGRRSGRDRMALFCSPILHSPHFLLLLFLNDFLSILPILLVELDFFTFLINPALLCSHQHYCLCNMAGTDTDSDKLLSRKQS